MIYPFFCAPTYHASDAIDDSRETAIQVLNIQLAPLSRYHEETWETRPETAGNVVVVGL